MPEPRRRPRRRGSARGRRWSPSPSRPSARCRATRRSAGSARAIWSARSMRSTGSWALAADRAGIQFRVLNRRKGPAVRGPRAQADRKLYRAAVQELLRAQDGSRQSSRARSPTSCWPTGGWPAWCSATGGELSAGAVVITTGTFLRGLIHIGEKKIPAGRVGEAPAVGLARTLERPGFRLGRLKTGTPPRLDGRTIDWAGLERQPGDEPPEPFSIADRGDHDAAGRLPHHPDDARRPMRSSGRTSTARRCIPGEIESRGPRYCPSIEDKIVRFGERDGHQIFLEPEGLDDDTVYPNGISTSLPEEVQAAVVASIPGLEKARIIRPGYAIEYDHVDPRELRPTLETRRIGGLVPGRPDQRHDRLRGGGGAGAGGRAECRPAGRRRATASRSAGRRAISA